MRTLHESIAGMLLGKVLSENHDEVVKHLNSSAGPHIGGPAELFKCLTTSS
jgi:hypothetical protein